MAENDNVFMKNIRDEAERVRHAIETGALDDLLPKFLEAIESRNEARREEVLKLVKETFGEGAEVTVNRVGPQFASPSPRGLFEKTEATPDETEAASGADEDGATNNPLAHLDEVEARMESEDGSDPEQAPAEQAYIPPERRGAIISGLHPSDMGE